MREKSSTISTSNVTNIHYLLPLAPASLTHERDFSTIFNNFQTLLAAFFHRIDKLTNLATFLEKPYGSVRRCRQCCEREVWLSRHSVASLCVCSLQWDERQRRSSAISWPYCSRAVSKGVKKQRFQAPVTYGQFGVINMSIDRLRILCPFLFFIICYLDCQSTAKTTT